MRIVHISDTHGKHRLLQNLPPAEVFIHSGDVSNIGSENEIMDFLEWFVELPYKYKIFVAGNHDYGLRGASIDGLPENCFYLCNSAVTIEGLKFYGVPLFMDDITEGDLDNSIRKIPADTDVLITHQPPHNILDFADNINYGDSILLQTVLKIKPTFHFFGHIHSAYGIKKNNSTTFVNAAILNEYDELVHKPVLVELPDIIHNH